jgi:hypothetical protein
MKNGYNYFMLFSICSLRAAKTRHNSVPIPILRRRECPRKSMSF